VTIVEEALDQLRVTVRGRLAEERNGSWSGLEVEQQDRLVDDWIESQLFLTRRALELGLPGIGEAIRRETERQWQRNDAPGAESPGQPLSDFLADTADVPWFVENVAIEGGLIAALGARPSRSRLRP
jgi:hypothetical protein